jgi:hypothetical protein
LVGKANRRGIEPSLVLIAMCFDPLELLLAKPIFPFNSSAFNKPRAAISVESVLFLVVARLL